MNDGGTTVNDMIQTDQTWRPVDGFPDYAVSSHGSVKRVVSRGTSRPGRILTQQILYGYCYVYLSSGGKVSACRVHRLVCAAFHGSPPTPQHHAAHNDGSRANNHFHNLRWATASENMLDKNAHGTASVGSRNGAHTKPDRIPRGDRNGRRTKPEAYPVGASHHSARLTDEGVRAIRNDPRSRRAIASSYGVSKCAVDGIKTGKTWRHVT